MEKKTVREILDFANKNRFVIVGYKVNLSDFFCPDAITAAGDYFFVEAFGDRTNTRAGQKFRTKLRNLTPEQKDELLEIFEKKVVLINGGWIVVR